MLGLREVITDVYSYITLCAVIAQWAKRLPQSDWSEIYPSVSHWICPHKTFFFTCILPLIKNGLMYF